MGMNITSVTMSVVVISLLRGGEPNQTKPYQSKARQSRAETQQRNLKQSTPEESIRRKRT